jgi:hypothetical protein
MSGGQMLGTSIKRLLFIFFLVAPNWCLAYSNPIDVAYDEISRRYFVTNKFTGIIDQIDSLGNVTNFATVPPNAEGIIARNDTLFVVSHGLTALDLETAEQLFHLDLSGQQGLSDIVLDTSGNIFISDYLANNVYRVHLGDLSVTVVVEGFMSVNGLYFDAKNNRLLATQWLEFSPLTEIRLSDYSLETVKSNEGWYWPNGITEDNSGNIYIASGSLGSIFRYDKSLANPPVVIASGYGNPVYIFYCRNEEELVIPEYTTNRLSFLSIHGPDLETTGFTDGSSGDQDGTPEAGEIGEFSITLINTRVDSLKNINISLSVDDPSLCILNRTISMNNIAVGDSADNDSDPFQFVIPDPYLPRIDTFLLEVSYQYRGLYVADTFRLGKNIGHPQILLVDNDNNSAVDTVYSNCFRAKRIPFDILNSTLINSSASLSPYQIVVWFSGPFRTNPLDTSQLTYLQSYLDNGGKLFLTGSGIASQLNAQGRTDFLYNYLHCDYNSTVSAALLCGTSSGQVFSLPDTIAFVTTSPNHIMPNNGGIGELLYHTKTTFGAVSYSGTYKTIFFGFNFDGIQNTVPRRINKDSVLTIILSFFGYNIPRLLMTVSVSPGDPMHLVSHLPAINWNYLTSGYSQQTYHLQIGSDNDWSSTEMWDYGPISGSATSATYAGSDLQDGQTYYIRLQVSDGTTSSPWQYGIMRLNSPPAAPTGLAPDNLQEFSGVTPSLSCANSIDNENDNKRYYFEVYDNDAMSTLLANIDHYSEGSSGTTIWQISPALATGNDYFWRVRANDGFEFGPWSDVASFLIKNPFICGDANGDTKINLLDVSYIINALYRSGPKPNPIQSADVNSDGKMNLLDISYLINYRYRGGPEPHCP